MKYIGVYNLDEEWATCDCSHVMKGNIYKHHMKVLKLMHLDLEEGKITRYGGSLKGIAIGWLHKMLRVVEHGYNMLGDVH